MAENKLNNKGYLAINDGKKNDKQPNFKGKIHINNKEYWIAGWDSDKDGVKLIKLTITDPEEYKNANPNMGNKDGIQNKQSVPSVSQSMLPDASPSDFDASIEDIEALYR